MTLFSRSLISALVLLVAACGTSTSTVTVPPGQIFVLGELEEGGFSASLRNVGDQDVTVETRDQAGASRASFVFPAGEATTVTVAAGESAVFVNATDRPARIEAVLSQDVSGMRYGSAPAEAMQDVVDPEAVGVMVGDWTGSLVYVDYTSGEETEIAAALQVRELEPGSWSVAFLYPDEPGANETSTLNVSEGGRVFDGRAVLSAAMDGDAYVVRTSQAAMDGGEDVVRFFTYRMGESELTIRTDYQTLGSTETRFRNAYRFTR